MTPELQNCLTWLANSVADSILNQKDPNAQCEELRQTWKTIYEYLKQKNLPDWRNLTLKEAKELRFGRWSNESDLWLIPLWLFPLIPEDLELTSIGGQKGLVSEVDTDTRFGCLAWGIILKEERLNADRTRGC